MYTRLLHFTNMYRNEVVMCDVFLKVVGLGTQHLFQLNSIEITSEVILRHFPQYVSALYYRHPEL